MDLAKVLEGQRAQLARQLLLRDDLLTETVRVEAAIAEQKALIAQTARLAHGQQQLAEQAPPEESHE